MNSSMLEVAAMMEFDCLPLPGGDGREDRARIRRRKHVQSVTERYHKVLEENPGINRKDALWLILGGFRMAFGFMFPWLGLALAIAEWLWDYEHPEICPD